jgi:hypothetical protein
MGLVHRVGWDPRFLERSPWFWPLARAGQRLAGHTDWPTAAELEALCAELGAGAGTPRLTMGPNVDKRDKRLEGRVRLEALYDARIALRGEVPTRERDWHDLFNVLCFATFPRIKHALHTRQYEALSRRVDPHAATLPPTRSREQDALTLFDEGGVVVVASPTRVAALAAAAAELPEASADALAVAIEAMPASEPLAVIPVGHALYEHLVEGLMMPGARAMLLPLDGPWPSSEVELLARADQGFAAVLSDPARFQSPREQAHLRLATLAPRRPLP